MRMKAFPNSRALSMHFAETAVIERIDAGSDPDSRTTVISVLRCGSLQLLDAQQRERAGLASSVQAVRVIAEVPNVDILPRDRFVIGANDFAVLAVNKTPVLNPSHVVILMQDDNTA